MTTAGADVARTFTIYGTDRNGNTQSEAITGIATGTSGYTKRDFLTVTRVAVDAATAGAIRVGTNGVGSSEWIVLDFLARVWFVGGGISGPASGTTYTPECTYDDPNKTGTTLVASPYQFSMEPASYVPPHVWPVPPTGTAISAASGDTSFNFANHPVFAVRLTINSGTGTVTMQVIQNSVGSGW